MAYRPPDPKDGRSVFVWVRSLVTLNGDCRKIMFPFGDTEVDETFVEQVFIPIPIEVYASAAHTQSDCQT